MLINIAESVLSHSGSFRVVQSTFPTVVVVVAKFAYETLLLRIKSIVRGRWMRRYCEGRATMGDAAARRIDRTYRRYGSRAPPLDGICVLLRGGGGDVRARLSRLCVDNGRRRSPSRAVLHAVLFTPFSLTVATATMTGHVYKKKRPPDGEPTEEERVIMHEGDASSSSGTSDVDRTSESNTPPRFLSPSSRLRQRLDLALHSTKAQA